MTAAARVGVASCDRVCRVFFSKSIDPVMSVVFSPQIAVPTVRTAPVLYIRRKMYAKMMTRATHDALAS